MSIIDNLMKRLAQELDKYQKNNAWTKTVECWHCQKNVPESHLLCGYCGAALHSPRLALTPQQEQVAEVETQQVTSIPARVTRVDPVKHPRLYRYRAYGQLTDTTRTEPLRLSPHQTRQLVKKYAE